MNTGDQFTGATGPESHIIAVLKKSRINVQKSVAVRDVALPNSTTGPHSKTLISKGEPFCLIHGVRSFYIGTTSGRIFAVCSNDADANNGQVPLIQGPGGQLLTPRERESQIIKTAFNALIRQNHMMRQPIRIPYSNPQPITSNLSFVTLNYTHNPQLTHPLQGDPADCTQDQYGHGMNHPNMLSNTSNYYPTMQNLNPIMMNQTGSFMGNNFMGGNINPVVTHRNNQGFPRLDMPLTMNSSQRWYILK